MKTVQNPTHFFFQQSCNPPTEYKNAIDEFVKQLINLQQCILCKEDYNFTDRLPRILIHCGHTFCHNCLTHFFKNFRIRCPLCIKLIKNIETLERLPINHTIFTQMAQEINKKNIQNGQEPIDYKAALIANFEAQQITKQQQQKIDPNQPFLDPETGLEVCAEHFNRIKHFFCMAHKKQCCRVCTETSHIGTECMVEIEDMQGFLLQFQENQDKNPQPEQKQIYTQKNNQNFDMMFDMGIQQSNPQNKMKEEQVFQDANFDDPDFNDDGVQLGSHSEINNTSLQNSPNDQS